MPAYIMAKITQTILANVQFDIISIRLKYFPPLRIDIAGFGLLLLVPQSNNR